MFFVLPSRVDIQSSIFLGDGTEIRAFISDAKSSIPLKFESHAWQNRTYTGSRMNTSHHEIGSTNSSNLLLLNIFLNWTIFAYQISTLAISIIITPISQLCFV